MLSQMMVPSDRPLDWMMHNDGTMALLRAGNGFNTAVGRALFISVWRLQVSHEPTPLRNGQHLSRL